MAEPTFLQVLTTVDDRNTALELARSVVAERLAACAQVSGPITSVYRWKGELEQADEWYCLMKTTSGSYEALAGWIAQHHPYETPEVIATPISSGAASYLAWLAAETVE